MKRVIVSMMMLLLAFSAFAGEGLTVSAVTGYTMTAFEDQEEAAGTLPLGVQIGKMLKPALEVGLEVVLPLGGFTYEGETMGYKVTTTFNQMLVGAYGKYCFGEGKVTPYAKAGVGYYTGNADVEIEYMGQTSSESADIESAVGFSVGGGAHVNEKVFAEFVYNIVSREDAGTNTWAVLVGYKVWSN